MKSDYPQILWITMWVTLADRPKATPDGPAGRFASKLRIPAASIRIRDLAEFLAIRTQVDSACVR